MAKQTAVDARYNLLSGNIRDRQRKESRVEDIFTILGGGLALGQAKLRNNRKKFNENADIIAAKVKNKNAIDLRDGFVNAQVEAGRNSLGGLGTYLEEKLRPKYEAQFNKNVEDESKFTDDSRSLFIDELVRDAVYGDFKLDATGKKTTERDASTGFLARLEALYAQGQNLKSGDDYDAYIKQKADLDDTVGGMLINRYVKGKTSSELNTEAVNRVLKDKYNENSMAFKTATLALQKDIGLDIASDLAEEVQKAEDNKKLQIRDKKRLRTEKASVSFRLDDGSDISIPYLYDVFDDPLNPTKEIYGPARHVPGNAPSFNYFNGGHTVTITESKETSHSFTGQPVSYTEISANVLTAPEEKKQDPNVKVFTPKDKEKNIQSLKKANNKKIVELEQMGRGDLITDEMKELYSRIYRNVKIANKAVKKADTNENKAYKAAYDSPNDDAQAEYLDSHLTDIAVIANHLALNNVRGVNDEVGTLPMAIASQIKLDNILYSPSDNLGGVKTQDPETININGIRALQAINNLRGTAEYQFIMSDFGLPEISAASTKADLVPTIEFVMSFLDDKSLLEYRDTEGRKDKNTLIPIIEFDNNARAYLLENIKPKEDRNDNGTKDLFNVKLAQEDTYRYLQRYGPSNAEMTGSPEDYVEITVYELLEYIRGSKKSSYYLKENFGKEPEKESVDTIDLKLLQEQTKNFNPLSTPTTN